MIYFDLRRRLDDQPSNLRQRANDDDLRRARRTGVADPLGRRVRLLAARHNAHREVYRFVDEAASSVLSQARFGSGQGIE